MLEIQNQIYRTMNATPPPDDSLRERDTLNPSFWPAMCPKPARSWPDDPELHQNKCGVCGTFFLGNKRRTVCRQCSDTADNILREAQKPVITELTERLHERTQGFLRTERKLRDELNMLKEILTGTLYSEVTMGVETVITYILLDGRVVGIHTLKGWDETLPFQGHVKISNNRPQL
jgi:hypothetical protein